MAIGELAQSDDWIEYEYDFGDSWEHEIVIRRIAEANQDIAYPLVIGGQDACPLEDCGGIRA